MRLLFKQERNVLKDLLEADSLTLARMLGMPR